MNKDLFHVGLEVSGLGERIERLGTRLIAESREKGHDRDKHHRH
ncbi:MAG: hypothetical protein WCA13_12715 [Terriglobales bacterium]